VIASAASDKPDLVLGLPTGRTSIPVYEELAKLHAQGELDLSRAGASNLDELQVAYLEAQNRRIALEANLGAQQAQAIADLEQKKAAFEKARIDAGVPPELLAQQEYDRLQLERHKAEKELEEARRALEAARETEAAELRIEEIKTEEAQRELQRVEENIRKLSLRAPQEGIFLVADHPFEGRPWKQGENIWPGHTVASLPDLGSLAVEAQLFDVDEGRLQPGQEVEIVLDAFPEEVYGGIVREVDGIAQSLQKSVRRAFRVKIAMESPDPERMRPGMSVKVVAKGEGPRDVLLVPRRALRWGPEGVRVRRAGGGEGAVKLGPCNPELCVALEGVEQGQRLLPAERAP
jgi:multidrug resistance efflux pump